METKRKCIKAVVADAGQLEWVFESGESEFTDCDLSTLAGCKVVVEHAVQLGIVRPADRLTWLDAVMASCGSVLATGHEIFSAVEPRDLDAEDL